MLKKLICLLIVLSMNLSLVAAESLWQDSSLYADNKARHKGDIFTIVVNEQTSATRSGTASNSKTASLGVDAGKGSLLDWLTQHSLGANDSFKSQGTATNSNNLQASITAQVMDVLPNGNLAIQGVQEIKQNKDVQKIIITGEIRPLDITAANTISSKKIANAKIAIEGKGPIADKQKQGILTQLVNFLF